MTKFGGRRVAFRFGVLLTALTAVLAGGLVPVRPAQAQVSSLPLQFPDVVIFATNSARLQSNAQVLAGHVVVNNASPGPTLGPGFELAIGFNVHTPAGYAIVGDSVQVSSNAVVGGNAFFNNLSNAGTIQGSQNTPLPPFPIFAPLPAFQASTPGTLDVTVPANQTQTLAPGNYRDIRVLSNATLKLSPGVYNVRSIFTDLNAKLLFQNLASGKADVRVQNQVTTGSNGIVRSDDGDPLKAAKIIFYVGFASGSGLTPNAVTFGSNGIIHANVYAPNGTLRMNDNVIATGAFLARDVDLGSNVHVDLETFFSQQAPTITSANATTFTVGQPGTFTVTTTGFPQPSITRAGAALPSGVTFVDNGNGTGTLSGTPAAGTGGTYAITFTASNGVPPNAVQNFTLTVNQPPTITSANATTFVVGQAGSFTVMTTGFPTPSITQGGALPAGVTFVNNGNGTGTLSGTPGPGTGGTYAITFTATNAAGSPTQNFTLTVNQAPAITSANATTFVVGQAGTFTVTTTGFPTPAIVQGGTLPPNVAFVNNGNGTGTLSGTPAAGTGGVYVLSFTASNGVPPDAVQNPFTLTVNEPPTAVDDGPYLTDANTPFSRATSDPDDLLDNDALGAPAATIASFGGGLLGGTVTSNAAGTTVNFGTGGSLTVESTGAFSFTPSAGFTGAFTFQYRLTNAGGSSDATVTIHVRPVAAPEIFPQTVVGNVIVNTSIGTIFSVLSNDVFSAPVSANLVSAGSSNGGTVTLNGGTGTFIYNPPVGFQGVDTFAYTITDSSGFTSAPAAVTVTVSGIIWFVNNNAGACSSLCNGRLTNPFTTLQAFTSVNDGVGFHPANNHNVFVYESATPYTFSTGTLLRTGQKLIGQDATATLATIAGVSVPSGSSLPAMNTAGNATTIGSTVALAASSTVRGLTVSTGPSTGVSGGAVASVAVSETIVTTTTETAVNLNGTGGTLSFTSVSANGAANGISLTNTTGSFAVTGDAGSANNGSGGTIQNTTSHAVALNNAQNVSLDQMNISGAGDSGVNGTGVTNFAFTNGTISNVGNAGFESAIAFNGSGTGLGNNLAGTLTVTGNTFLNPFYSGLDVQSSDGTVTNANVSNNTITNPGFSGINIVGTGNATTVFGLNGASINQNNISSSGGNGIQVSIGNVSAAGPGATAGIPNDASNRIDITNNSIALDGTGTQAIVVADIGGNSASRSMANFVIECNGKNTGGCTAPTANPISGSSGGTTVLIGNNGYATMVGVINNNSIDANHTVAFAGNGIGGGNGVAGAGNAWTPDLTLTVTNNTITRTDGNGILLVGRGTSGTAKLKIATNNVGAPLNGVRPGIRVDAGNAASADDSVCLDISSNVSAGSGGSPGIGLRKQGSNPAINDFGVEGMVATSSPGVEAYVDGLNPAGGGTLLISATSGFSNCSTAP